MFEFSGYHVMLAGIGVAIILAHWLPRFLSGREPATSALMIGFGWLAFGWIPGMPDAIGPIGNGGLWETVSEICVIVGLFGVGLRIDQLSNRERWKPTLRLLIVAMPATIAAVALLGWAAGGMTVAGAILLGAVLAPTDPVLAGDVEVGPPLEGGEHPVRFTLTTEAGLNDGLAFPFVHLGLAIAAAGAATLPLLGEWAARDLAYRVAVGALGGACVGWLLGKILFSWPRANPLADTQSAVVALAGVLAAYGFTELVEGYGFIAAFVAGVVLRRMESEHAFHVDLHDFAQAIEHALTAFLLLALGAALPTLLGALDWAGAMIGVVLIFLIRPLVGWTSMAGTALGGRARLVVAFYGVRGIGTIYYLSYAITHVELRDKEAMWAIAAFTILLSTIVHGLTAGAAVERVGRSEPEAG